MLHFAELVGDSERVIDYWIAEEQWSKAVQMLRRNVRLSMFDEVNSSDPLK